ncbi:MAG: DUF2828 family protein [Clostridia bacterium]|nr:DUF2828 family protein [Clostridia bacterium]
MLNYLKHEAAKTYTENDARTYRSTGADCLDLFSSIGAIRRNTEEDIIDRFLRAFTENPDLAIKILFFGRDVRGGLGERRVFRILLKWLAENAPQSLRKNIGYIAEYGRWDDLLALLDTPCRSDALRVIETQLEADKKALAAGDEVSLLAKWLPSVNASNAETVRHAKTVAKHLGMTDAQYRKTLVALRAKIRIIENNLREKDYTFDYEKQPSKAMFKYRAAFSRNDGERYGAFLARVEKGEAKLHADTLAPYELVEPYLDYRFARGVSSNMRKISENEKATLNATWASLPHYGNDENALAVIDTSGSMYGGSRPLPAAVALSLGLYFAEHNKGAFANSFIEFSAKPQLIEVKGDTFADRLRYICTFNRIANTNVDAVFDLILETAVRHHVPQEELPSTLYLISDMEFDCCVENAELTNFERAAARFAAQGYKLPNVVFWNVASRHGHQPVRMNDAGVALVSGCTPRLFDMVMRGELSPYKMMMEIIGSERYEKIAA